MIRRLLRVESLIGDPTETALTGMGFSLGFSADVISENPRVKEVPFDSDRKLMTTVNKVRRQVYGLYKGRS